MRVNVEDDLWTSNRLSKLARTLKISEKEALGGLVCVWRRTQNAAIATASVDRLVTLIVIDFESDEEARHFLMAMVAAQLAEMLDEGRIHIIGNDEHCNRVAKLRGHARAGGEARSAQIRNGFVAVTEPAQSHHAALPAPCSLLPAPKKRSTPSAQDPLVEEVVTEHRRLLREYRSLEPSAIVSAQTKKHASQIAKHWPNDWRAVMAFFVMTNTEGLKRNKWPIGWLAKYADDYDTQFQNRKRTGAKTVSQIEAEAQEYERMLQRRAQEAESV